MDISELSLEDLSIERVEHKDAHGARARANQLCNLGWHIATLPDVIRWRLDRSDSPDNREKINTGWCLTDTEEYVVMTPENRNEILVIHGGALFTKPGMVKQLEEESFERGLEIDLADSYYLRAGVNVNMKALDMFPYERFLKVDEIPSRYGVRIDEMHMVDRPNGWHSIDSFYDNPLLIARCGGAEQASDYLDTLKQSGETNLQFEHEFNRRGKIPFGYIVQTLGCANISQFFGDLSEMNKPYYVLAKEKQFKEQSGWYRDPPQRS